MHVFIAWFCGPGCCALLSITSLPVLWGSMTQPQRGSGSCSLLSGTAGHLPFSHLLSCRQPPPQLPRICCRVQHTVGRGSVQSTPAAPLWGAHSAFCRVSETFSGFPCPSAQTVQSLTGIFSVALGGSPPVWLFFIECAFLYCSLCSSLLLVAGQCWWAAGL